MAEANDPDLRAPDPASAGPAVTPARTARLAAVRADARAAADEALAAAGFARDADGRWRGRLPGGPPAGGLSVAVALPPRFPDALPDVFVDRPALPRRVAHVEQSGKVCIAPGSGVLLDAGRPAALVAEALERAARTVGDGLLGWTDADLRQEFLAYWPNGTGGSALTICSPNGPARPLARVRVGAFGDIAAGTILLADAAADAERWTRAVGTKASRAGAAFLVPMAVAFDPPDFGEDLSIRGTRDLVDAHASEADAAAFRAWIADADLPATVVLSLPEPSDGAGRALVLATLPAPRGDAAKRASAGFRPGRIPAERQLGFAATQRVERRNPVRLDREFLAARGGAAPLGDRTVTLVGAGAVGSEIAVHLASLGVGLVRIVDHDSVEAANVHRHALGVSALGRPKARALAAHLRARFPHLRFEAVVERAEDALGAWPAAFEAANLVVLATGEETLERRLNALLAGGPPRVHAWVEPLGVAGHALACGVAGKAGRAAGVGCYECLFEVREGIGLVNRSALTAPGQEIRRSLAGCAGTFSPFSALDARRSALEAAELAGRLLRGVEDDPVLVTWRGDRSEFEAAGLRLSPRARAVPAGGRARVLGVQFARAGCPVCGGARGAAVGGEAS